MSWTYTQVGANRVWENARNGNCTVLDELSDNLVDIAAKDRPAAALAVLGGVTDELVERLADEFLNLTMLESLVDRYDESDRDLYADAREAVKTFLDAVFKA